MILTSLVRVSVVPSCLLLRSLPSSASRRTVHFCSMADRPAPEKDQKPTRDAMEESFGEAYATRSDEEGFGGTYSGQQTLRKEADPQKPTIAEYDKSQGSVVAEKEKSRHQTNI